MICMFKVINYCLQVYLKTFFLKCIEIYELDPAWFLDVELLTHIYMLLMMEKGIRGGICHAIYRYAAANNKYMKNYNKHHESPHIMYLDKKQSVSKDNVSKITCRWFSIEK